MRISAVTTCRLLLDVYAYDMGGEFAGRDSTTVRGRNTIRQESTMPDTPKLSGVVEGGLGLVKESAYAAALKRPVYFLTCSSSQLP